MEQRRAGDFQRNAILMMVCVMLVIGVVKSDSHVKSADRIMAGCLYHLIRLTRWPEPFSDEPDIQVGFICGEDAGVMTQFEAELRTASDSRLSLKPRRFDLDRIIGDKDSMDPSILKELLQCRILYFEKGTETCIQQLSSHLQNQAVLTVAGNEQFPDDKGMVGFYIRNQNVQIKVNLKKIEDASLTISAQFLQHASY